MRGGEIKKLARMIENIEFGMFTTEGPDGRMHSRPMETSEIDREGHLWFLTVRHSLKVHEIESNPEVCVTYANPAAAHFISISGRAEVVDDRQKVHELWSPGDETWLERGPDHAEVLLIRVDILRAEYWDHFSGKMVTVVTPGDEPELELVI
ncbi:MAG TPA: pyridoxamine 5'-phosphate oxidase family protein [Bdellovibrionota bacterium]|nr:pyridoxamine 5'-phosphate oxidase family protein [Bdellovibrionota bacterium]